LDEIIPRKNLSMQFRSANMRLSNLNILKATQQEIVKGMKDGAFSKKQQTQEH
jgi:hypothetical protein